MKKLLGIIVLGLLLTNNTNAGTLEEDWARDTEIYMEGIKKCQEYAQQSGSWNSEQFTMCTTKFKEMDNARIKRREAAKKHGENWLVNKDYDHTKKRFVSVAQNRGEYGKGTKNT